MTKLFEEVQVRDPKAAEKLQKAKALLRIKLLEPQASIVAGFRPIMPTFKGQLTDQDISAIIAFIKAQK